MMENRGKHLNISDLTEYWYDKCLPSFEQSEEEPGGLASAQYQITK